MNALNTDLPTPFLFNALKHHHGYQLDFIQKIKKNKQAQNQINNLLVKVGRLMIDLYYGTMSPLEITTEIENWLKSTGHFQEDSYHDFVNEAGKKYRIIELSDGSSWTLLIGRDHGRYVHIHPCRGSKNTIRVGAIALKTAICLKIFCGDKLSKESLVTLTNEVRKKYLAEPPIKNEIYTKGIRRVLNLF